MNQSNETAACFSPGCTVQNGITAFCVYAPKLTQVDVEVYDSYDSARPTRFKMVLQEGGFWTVKVHADLTGYYYGYRLQYPEEYSPFLEKTEELVADPYGRLQATRNHYLQYPKTKIISPDFDWGSDTFETPGDIRDLIIYETHIKDLVAHPTAESPGNGVYTDFIHSKTGGIAHLKKLGINAVEFLPLQQFAYFEPPFNAEIPGGFKNTWNPYGINYWGYMTSAFFAPHTLYGSQATLKAGAVNGTDESVINELKSLIKALHENGIAVILDVVYNHISQYDLNPLRFLDKQKYLRMDPDGFPINDSWTGNDFRTEAPVSRKLITDSVVYWMKEYHFDGFRFDLAGLIDEETIVEIKTAAQSVNPAVLLIAEPWGGMYKPEKFSEFGWASWNDKLRNAVKGYDPKEHRGYLFGEWIHGVTRYALENFIRGTLKGSDQGLFQSSKHSVNYLESHDGYTLADFIRIALNRENASRKFNPSEEPLGLTEDELCISKLAALFLFVSQGACMIHAGQEFARSKVVQGNPETDTQTGLLDHDSYNKDSQTNYLNFDGQNTNSGLYTYYLGLITLRKSCAAFRKAEPDQVHFKVYRQALHITFELFAPQTGDPHHYFVSINADPSASHEIILPEGKWQVLVNAQSAGILPIQEVENALFVPSRSGVVLRQLHELKS